MTYQEYEEQVKREMNKVKLQKRMFRIQAWVMFSLISILAVACVAGNILRF